jgi:hypothetical protein
METQEGTAICFQGKKQDSSNKYVGNQTLKFQGPLDIKIYKQTHVIAYKGELK